MKVVVDGKEVQRSVDHVKHHAVTGMLAYYPDIRDNETAVRMVDGTVHLVKMRN